MSAAVGLIVGLAAQQFAFWLLRTLLWELSLEAQVIGSTIIGGLLAVLAMPLFVAP